MAAIQRLGVLGVRVDEFGPCRTDVHPDAEAVVSAIADLPRMQREDGVIVDLARLVVRHAAGLAAPWMPEDAPKWYAVDWRGDLVDPADAGRRRGRGRPIVIREHWDMRGGQVLRSRAVREPHGLCPVRVVPSPEEVAMIRAEYQRWFFALDVLAARFAPHDYKLAAHRVTSVGALPQPWEVAKGVDAGPKS